MLVGGSTVTTTRPIPYLRGEISTMGTVGIAGVFSATRQSPDRTLAERILEDACWTVEVIVTMSPPRSEILALACFDTTIRVSIKNLPLVVDLREAGLCGTLVPAGETRPPRPRPRRPTQPRGGKFFILPRPAAIAASPTARTPRSAAPSGPLPSALWPPPARRALPPPYWVGPLGPVAGGAGNQNRHRRIASGLRCYSTARIIAQVCRFVKSLSENC